MDSETEKKAPARANAGFVEIAPPPRRISARDRAEILELLPHRPPFLFVDRIVERHKRKIACEWDVTAELDCFRGHYPGEPVLPGVLISEFAFQSGALLIYGRSHEDRETAGVPVLTKIEEARFKRVVRPGTTLRAQVKLDEELGAARYLSAKVTAGGKTVARMRFVLAHATPEEVVDEVSGEVPGP